MTAENLTPPTPDPGQEDLEHELEMIWRFGVGVDLGEVDLEQDVEIGAGTEMMKLEKQVVEMMKLEKQVVEMMELEKQVENGWGEKGRQLQHSPGLADAQWNS